MSKIEETTYTLLGVRSDGSVPVVDLMECDNDAQALSRLEDWIADHATCTTAELWRGGEKIGVVQDDAPTADRKFG